MAKFVQILSGKKIGIRKFLSALNTKHEECNDQWIVMLLFARFLLLPVFILQISLNSRVFNYRLFFYRNIPLCPTIVTKRCVVEKETKRKISKWIHMKEFLLISSNYKLKLVQSQQQYLLFSRISWRSHRTNPALFLSPGVVYCRGLNKVSMILAGRNTFATKLLSRQLSSSPGGAPIFAFLCLLGNLLIGHGLSSYHVWPQNVQKRWRLFYLESYF